MERKRNTEKQKNDIEQLIRILDRLEINNNNLTKEFKEVREAVDEVVHKIDHTHTNNKGRHYSRKLEIEDITIGDKVLIINSTKNQQNKGTVTGFTTTGQVRVRTNNGNIVRRRAFNLQHL